MKAKITSEQLGKIASEYNTVLRRLGYADGVLEVEAKKRSLIPVQEINATANAFLAGLRGR